MKSRFLILLAALTLTPLAHANKEAGNGGDLCEDRVKIIRDDIKSWINQGGSAGLSLPGGLTVEQYNSSMLNEIANAHIRCTDSPVTVGGAEKTCMNNVDKDGLPQILCERAAFNDAARGDQYILVHHEFAGLAGFEVSNGDDSNYSISNQLTGFLQTLEVTKLAIVKQAPLPPYDIQKNFADFVGHYRIVDCTEYSNHLAGPAASSAAACKARKTDAQIYFGDGYFSPNPTGHWLLFTWAKGVNPESSAVAADADANENYINYSEICSIDYGRFSCNAASLHLTTSFTIYKNNGLYYVEIDFARSAAIDNGSPTDLEVSKQTYVLKKLTP